MNDESTTSAPPVRVPTLTEVIDLPGAGPVPASESAAASDGIEPAVAPPNVEPAAAPAVIDAAQLPNEQELTQQVLAEVQRQVDLLLEYRMREMLSPLLARLTDGLVREARSELASTLRDVVARAVAQELSRHRGRGTAR
ncbi:MAG: hypothetical protein JSR59_10445 [Proteobacteria bacterium]|nr:hypothetical protein [Pseudomonadota bacterium]